MRAHRVVTQSPASPKRRMNPWPYIFTAPFFVSLLMFTVFPVVYSLVISFTDWNGFGAMQFVGLKNYHRLLFEDPRFFASLRNTLLINSISIPLTLLLALVMAYLFTVVRIRGNSVFKMMIFLPYITTPVAIGIIFSLLFDVQTGMVNQLLAALGHMGEKIPWTNDPALSRVVVALMILWKYMGYVTVLLLSGLVSVPRELHEAAIVDGAGPLKRFLRIDIPMIRPTMIFVVITSIIGGLQLFDEPMLLFSRTGQPVGGPSRACLTMVMNLYDVAFSSFEFGYGSAIAYGVFVIIAVLSIFLMKGMTRKEAL